VCSSDLPLTTLTALSDTVSFPPAYNEAITYNLALRLGPAYGQEPTPTMVAIAHESKQALQKRNLRPPFLASDAVIPSNNIPINWRTGAPYGSPYA
jgi:hypothetical protein